MSDAIVANQNTMEERNMEERDLYRNLYAELEKYENRGVSIRLNNQPASPMQIVTAHMVKEENAYMRDYVWDEQGDVKEIGFHSISNS